MEMWTKIRNNISISGLFIGILINLSQAEKRVVCYYGSWSTYRHGNGAFNVANIDPHLCTHVIYTFFGIGNTGTVRILDPFLDLEDNWGRGNIKKFNDLKIANPKLKTLAAVGGWNEGSTTFSQVARNNEARQSFARDATSFCKRYGFDGLDLDWEYPGQRDGDAAIDKANFVLLLKELRKQFDQNELILTAAVAAAEFSASISYDIPSISRYLDFINVMAYDLHGPWDMRTGINAPLYEGLADVTSMQKQLNVNASIHYWLREGAPREKIVLGMPLYGRTFQLRDNSKTAVGSYHSGPGLGGRYSNEPGMIGYNEFCESQLTNHWSRNWDVLQQVPYAFSGNQWVGYEDIESISIKADFVNDLQLGGAMFWSLETDDFLGICGQGKYPLVNAVKTVLKFGLVETTTIDGAASEPTTIQDLWTPSTEDLVTTDGTITTTTDEIQTSTEISATAAPDITTPSSLPTITEEVTTESTETPTEITTSVESVMPPVSTTTLSTTSAKTTPSSSSTTISAGGVCGEESIFRDPNDCSAFYICDNDVPYHFKCPSPLLFDDVPKVCNWPRNVEC